MKKTMHVLHITHNDADAIGCALVVDLYFSKKYTNPGVDVVIDTSFNAIANVNKEVERILTTPDEVRGYQYDVIYITDISLSNENCRLCEKYIADHRTEFEIEKRLAGYDHHKTNNLDDEFPWFIVTLVKNYPINISENIKIPISASEICLNYTLTNKMQTFSNDNASKMYNNFCDMIYSISRYDTWVWKTHPKVKFINDNIDNRLCIADDVIPVLAKFYGIEETYLKLRKIINCIIYESEFQINQFNSEITEMKEMYKILKDKELKDVEKQVRYTRVISWENYRVALMLSENFSANAAADYINRNFTDIDLTIYIIPATKQLAFRSSKDNVDVSSIVVENFGADRAGGHKGAAGARLTTDEFIEYLRLYYDSKDYLIGRYYVFKFD